MRKLLSTALLSVLISCFVVSGVNAQRYSAYGLDQSETNHFETYDFLLDTMDLHWNNIPADIYSLATLTIFFEGNYTDQFEVVDVYNLQGTYLGTVGPNRYFQDCSLDSGVLVLPASDILASLVGNTFTIRLIPSSQVDLNCPDNKVSARLEVYHCANGPAAQFATVVSMPDFLCQGDLFNFTGNPSGGVFSGEGFSGNQLNTAGLNTGNHTIYYEAADSIGCVTQIQLSYYLRPTPQITAVNLACPGDSVTLTTSTPLHIAWFNDSLFSQSLGEQNSLTVPLNNSQTFYLNSIEAERYFYLDTMDVTPFDKVDHDAYSGDDRGGIATSLTHVYTVGDIATVRYDLNLQNPVALPQRDGLFSDLSNGKLWTLYNSTTATAPEHPFNLFMVNAICEMDSDLNLTSNVISLSSEIPMNTQFHHCGVFAGSGFVILYSGLTSKWYKVNLADGFVEEVGYTADPEFFYSESWAVWGIGQYDSNGYSVLYRDINSTTDILKRNLNDNSTSVFLSTAGVGDMASFTYCKGNTRWYWHYEGANAAFLGGTETMGWADGSHVDLTINNSIGCGSSHAIQVPTLHLNDTTVCKQSLTLEAEAGYLTYTWNGQSGNNTYSIDSTSNIVLVVEDTNNCILSDTIAVQMAENPVIDLGSDTSICQSASLTISVDGGYVSYNWNGQVGNDTSLTVTSSQTVYLTVTDANGCSGTDSVQIGLHQGPVVELGNDTAFCQSNYLLQLPAGYSTYEWNGTSSTSNTYDVTSSETVRVIVTDNNGCQQSDSIAIQMWDYPVVSLTGLNAPCNDSLVIDAGNPGSTYLWQDNSTAGNITIYPAPQAQFIRLSVTNSNGCTTTDSAMAYVYGPPTLDLGADTTLCQQTLTLTAPVGFAAYYWNGTSGTNEFDVQSDAFVRLQITDSLGCQANDSIDIRMNALPVVNLGGSISTCADSLVLDATNNNSQYLWSDLSTNATNTLYPDTNTRTIWVTVTDASGCVNSDTAQVLLLSQPDATFTLPSTICINAGTIQIVANDTTGIFSGPGISPDGLFDPQAAGLGTMSIQYLVTNAANCQSVSVQQIMVDACSGLSENEILEIKAFANQQQQIVLAWPAKSADQFRFTLMELQGKVIKQGIYHSTGLSSAIDLPSLTKGMYLIQVDQEGKRFRKKLILGN